MSFKGAMATVAVAAAILAPSKCENSEEVHAKVCVEGTKSNANGSDFYKRLSDSDCEKGKKGARWRYYSGGTQIPKVGGRAPAGSGSFTEPSGSLVRIPTGGGTGNEEANK